MKNKLIWVKCDECGKHFIASLQNLLNYTIEGMPYNYAYHWPNKIGYNGIDDSLLDDFIKEGTNEDT